MSATETLHRETPSPTPRRKGKAPAPRMGKNAVFYGFYLPSEDREFALESGGAAWLRGLIEKAKAEQS